MIICPKCDYWDGYGEVNGKFQQIDGKHGAFYTLPIQLAQKEFFQKSEKELLGCPNCGTVFMEGCFPNDKQNHSEMEKSGE